MAYTQVPNFFPLQKKKTRGYCPWGVFFRGEYIPRGGICPHGVFSGGIFRGGGGIFWGLFSGEIFSAVSFFFRFVFKGYFHVFFAFGCFPGLIPATLKVNKGAILLQAIRFFGLNYAHKFSLSLKNFG